MRTELELVVSKQFVEDVRFVIKSMTFALSFVLFVFRGGRIFMCKILLILELVSHGIDIKTPTV